MESFSSKNGSNFVSVSLSNLEAGLDQHKSILGLFETQFLEKVGFPIQSEDIHTMVHIGAQVLAEGDPDKFRAKLILGEIAPADLALLRVAASQMKHDEIYNESFEAGHKIFDLWHEINKKHRQRIENSFR